MRITITEATKTQIQSALDALTAELERLRVMIEVLRTEQGD